MKIYKTFLIVTMIITLIITLLSGCSIKANPRNAIHQWQDEERVIIDPQSGVSYSRQQVTVTSGQDKIAAVFMKPVGIHQPPVMLVVSGSRDGILTPENPLNRALLSQGVAILNLGKKGVMPSTGSWKTESFYDRANNVLAALDWLSDRQDINHQKVIIYGHSQAGYVVPLMADDPRIAGLVLAAAPVESVRQQIHSDKVETEIRQGKSQAAAYAAASRQQKMLDLLMQLCPVIKAHYLCNIYHFDPKPALAEIQKPTLVLYASNDPMVPPRQNMAPMAELLKRNSEAQIVLISGGNHMFWDSRTGLPEEYMSLIGPPAEFPLANPNNSDHIRLAELAANRVKISPGFQEAVLQFVKRVVL